MNAKWVERDQQPTEMLGTGRGYVAVYKDSDLGVLIPTSYLYCSHSLWNEKSCYT